MMHIAFLTPEYPHPELTSSGGLGTSIKNMASGLVENNFKVTIFVYSQKQTKIINEKGITLHAIEKKLFQIGGWFLYRKLLQHYINKQVLLSNIDAIEAPDWTGITAFIKFKCPLVIRFHGSDAYFCKLEERGQKKKNFWFEKLALQGADHMVSVSRFTADETRKIFSLKKDIAIIPNAVNTDIFKPRLNVIYDAPFILYFGTLIRKKGVLEIPKIFNTVATKNKDVKLILAGNDVIDIKTGKSTWELFADLLDERYTDRVSWLGPQPYDDVIELIASAEVIILPSYAEALPMTWIEAMAMEKALVTSDIGWAEEVMINAETGFMVSPNDHEKYAGRILELLDDEQMRKKLGKMARERVESHFSTHVVNEQNIQFYRQIIEK